MSLLALLPGFADRFGRRIGFLALSLAYALLVAACIASLLMENELSLGRNPLANLAKTAVEFARPSFLDAWSGNPNLEYRSDDGTLLRVEDRRAVERTFLLAVARGTWTTLQIATLGSLLALLLALPLALLSARNLGAPRPLAVAARGVLGAARAVHTPVSYTHLTLPTNREV